MSAQFPHQRSCQDIRMDPHYQKPPHYAEIHHHRPVPQMPVEVNEIGPTIQQGVIQHPVQRDTQATRSRRSTPPMNTQETTSVHNLQITGNRGTEKETSCRNKKMIRILMIMYLTVSTKTDHLH